MQAEGIIAALVGAVSGGGGMRLLGRLVGPERDVAIAEYYRGVIKGLREENEELRGQLRSLEDRIVQLELSQDDPPGFMS